MLTIIKAIASLFNFGNFEKILLCILDGTGIDPKYSPEAKDGPKTVSSKSSRAKTRNWV